MNAIRDIKAWWERRTLRNTSIGQLLERRMFLHNQLGLASEKLKDYRNQKERLVDDFIEAKRLDLSERREYLALQLRVLTTEISSKKLFVDRLTKESMLLIGLERLKENEQWLQDSGRAGVFNMDMERLQEYVEQASAKGELDMERLDSLLYTLEDIEARALEGLDASTEAAMRELERLAQEKTLASAESREAAAIEEELAKMESGIADLRQPHPSTWI